MKPNEDLETLQKTINEEVPSSNLETAIFNLKTAIFVGLSIVCFFMGIIELWLVGPFMSGVLGSPSPTGYTLGFHLVGIPIFFLSGYLLLRQTSEVRKIISGTILFFVSNIIYKLLI